MLKTTETKNAVITSTMLGTEDHGIFKGGKMNITKAEDMIQRGLYHPKFMIIGEPGGGKTTALTTFPPSWRVLVLDFFGNKESLEGASNVEVISYADLDPKDPEAWLTLQQDKATRQEGIS